MGHIYIEKVEFPYQNLPALKKIKVPSFLTKPLFSAKQPNRAKCHEMKSGGKIGKRRVLGNEFFLQFWYLESNHTICQHAVLRPFRFLALSVFFQSSLYPRSSHIFIHLKIFPWCTLVTWSQLRKPRSKLRYLGVTFETLKIPGEPRNGGDCTMDNNLRGLRSNSTIVIQNTIGKMQLGRQTFRIKSY